MHERRNTVLAVILIVAGFWVAFAWLIAPDYAPWVPGGVMGHRIASLSVA